MREQSFWLPGSFGRPRMHVSFVAPTSTLQINPSVLYVCHAGIIRGPPTLNSRPLKYSRSSWYDSDSTEIESYMIDSTWVSIGAQSAEGFSDSALSCRSLLLRMRSSSINPILRPGHRSYCISQPGCDMEYALLLVSPGSQKMRTPVFL